MKLKRHAIYCAVRVTIEAVIAFIAVILFLSLIGCKTPVKTERSVQIDSISIREVNTVSYDSLMQRILSSLTFDFEYSLIEWSKPDEEGVQYKAKEHNLKASGVAETETETVHVSTSSIVETATTEVARKETETSTPTQVKTWWDNILIKIGGVALVIIIAVAVYLFVKKKASFSKFYFLC